MSKFHISLTEVEAALVQKIDLRVRHCTHDEGRAAYLGNHEPILTLLESLSVRKAVPVQRLKWWADPTYNQGRIKASRKGVFERNGRQGTEIYAHPHFIPHLFYFLYGANLPPDVMEAFEVKVGNPDWVTSGDVPLLSKLARDLVRKAKLDKSEAPDEFFKLCLDLGLGLSTSASVMRAAKGVR